MFGYQPFASPLPHVVHPQPAAQALRAQPQPASQSVARPTPTKLNPAPKAPSPQSTKSTRASAKRMFAGDFAETDDEALAAVEEEVAQANRKQAKKPHPLRGDKQRDDEDYEVEGDSSDEGSPKKRRKKQKENENETEAEKEDGGQEMDTDSVPSAHKLKNRKYTRTHAGYGKQRQRQGQRESEEVKRRQSWKLEHSSQEGCACDVRR